MPIGSALCRPAPFCYYTPRGGARRVPAMRRFRNLLVARQAIMAGKFQLAAKCLLGSSLLAAGGSGVYYTTTHGLPMTAVAHAATPATATPAAASSDLDAVASAWAEPAPAHTTTQSSPVARSAEKEKAKDVAPVAKSSTGDRYAVKADPSAKVPTPAD